MIDTAQKLAILQIVIFAAQIPLLIVLHRFGTREQVIRATTIAMIAAVTCCIIDNIKLLIATGFFG